MDFSRVQNRFINGKVSGVQLLKGKKGAGKTIASIYRTINLENNYCIYKEDNILLLTSHYKQTKKALEMYESEKNKDFFYSLFSLEGDRVKVKTLGDIIEAFSNGYKRSRSLALKYIPQDMHINMLINLQEFVDNFSKKSKLINSLSLEFLLEEILWIKSCALTREEYLTVKRPGRGKSIRSNSVAREYIYELVELYNSELIYNGYMDMYDDVLFALKYAKSSKEKYTHILIDDCELLTRGELEFAKSIFADKSHSSLIYIFNNGLVDRKNTWIRKGRSYKELGADFKGKTFNFNKVYAVEGEEVQPNVIDYFKFINFKTKKELDFSVDATSNSKELLLDNKALNQRDTIKIPVYSDIAAGVPIEMRDVVENQMLLPKEWVGKMDDLFILNVKGDSMIDKNILDGDRVVIKRQTTAYHNDIVAASLDGEATLKILKSNGCDDPFLMPANTRYKPIPLNNKDVSIMGVAVGIIKSNN
ncbi:MAG: LexA family protein [Clostridium sp.]